MKRKQLLKCLLHGANTLAFYPIAIVSRCLAVSDIFYLHHVLHIFFASFDVFIPITRNSNLHHILLKVALSETCLQLMDLHSWEFPGEVG